MHRQAPQAQRRTAARQSLPPLKAPWFDDESIADARADDAPNRMREAQAAVPVESLTIQGVFDRLSRSSDEPASG